MLYDYFIPGKSSKKNMYQAINDAMDTVMRKDPNSGNFQCKLIICNKMSLFMHKCINCLYHLSSNLFNESQSLQF